jgi:orotidine-5'-phosphate decarboxylase
VVARRIARWSAEAAPGACGAVVGATGGRELAAVRRLLPDAPLLIPGIGAQGGALTAIRAGLNAAGHGAIVNASREVTYASDGADFAAAARRTATALRDAIERERRPGP